MRVLFINTIDTSSEVETRYPNLGVGYLASALRDRFGKSFFEFKAIDSGIKTAIPEFKPDLVCLTSVTQNYHVVKACAAEAKSHNLPVIIGGIHISMLPGTLSSDMDVGCIGEGEKTIVDLLSLFISKGRFLKDDLAQIKGIVYHDAQGIVTTPKREQISDLDQVPFPARDLLKIDRHSYMFTSRGCPYNCIFCSSTRFWDKLRFFSAEYVVREIEELLEGYNVKIISFFDDLFIGNIPRLRKIVEILEGKDFLRRVKFTCSARANLINEEVAALLKRMRVFSVGMGLESGSNETLKYLKGNNISVEDNKRAVALLSKYKIAANASFVIGSPRETREEIVKTYLFVKNNPLRLFDTYVLTPFPGTGVWEYAKGKGLVSDDMDWKKLNINFGVNSKDAVILSEVLSREEIVKIFRKFQILRFFKNARNVWFTPQIFDLPKIIFKTFTGCLVRIFTKTIKGVSGSYGNK
jgi:radical SAM superfamily enzyme YgiQ (UPF0313 family)